MKTHEKLSKEDLQLLYNIVKERENELKEKEKSTLPFVSDFAERLLYMITPLKEKLKTLLEM